MHLFFFYTDFNIPEGWGAGTRIVALKHLMGWTLHPFPSQTAIRTITTTHNVAICSHVDDSEI